ncbi:MAG: hypothetical protein KDC26_04810 [Armatimonadetes bacterium]|nr:hypothetical protein [Armatimonadota bacterium]
MSDWSIRAKEYGRWAWREQYFRAFAVFPIMAIFSLFKTLDQAPIGEKLFYVVLAIIYFVISGHLRKRVSQYELNWKEATEFDEAVHKELLPGKEHKLFLEHLAAEQYEHGAGYVWYFANQHKEREPVAHQLVEQEGLVNAVGKVVRNVKVDRDPKGPSRWIGWLGCLSIPVLGLTLRFAPKRLLDVFVPGAAIIFLLLIGAYFWLLSRDQINEERLAQFQEHFSGLRDDIKEILRKDSTVRRLERASQK